MRLCKKVLGDFFKACGVKKLRLSLETVFVSRAHIRPFIPQRDTVSSTCVNLFLLRLQTNPFKTPWLIIYPGKEMPKPRETHHQERKGHSSPAHKYTHFDSHSHTTVMDGNNIFIRASGRQSFHPLVQIPLGPRAKQKLDWWGEIFKRTSKKSPHLKTHVRGGEPSDQ